MENYPILFGTPEETERMYHPERFIDHPPSVETAKAESVDLADEDAGKKLFGGLIRRSDEDVEPLAVQAEIIAPLAGAYPPQTLYPPALQVNGGLFVYRQDQTTSVKQQPAEAGPRQSVAPKGLDLTDKLIRKQHFAKCEGQLYVYAEKRGIHIPLSCDDAKDVIAACLEEDLRIRGAAYQLTEVYELLRHHPHVKVVEKPPKHLQAFTNGVLDLRTSTFTYGHDPENFVTWRLEIPFDLSQNDCPTFRSVLHQISGGDPALIRRVLEVLAFLMIPCAFTKAIPLFQGLSGTGKSLVARLISSFYDPACISHVAAYQFRDRFSTATLLGKQLNISMDLPGGKIGPEAAAMLKQITGGDEVFVETKGVDGHSAHLDCRFLFGTNHPFVPSVRDEAFLDRIILLPFRYPVPPEIADPDLLQKLLPERTAIFNMVLDAFWLWQKDHYRFYGEELYGIRAAGLGNDEADPMVAAFIRECCVVESSAFIPTAELFAAYQQFLIDRGYPASGNSQQFSRLFNEATSSNVFTKKIRVNGKSANCYVGVTLKGENHEK